jgi:hypothetical protein
LSIALERKNNSNEETSTITLRRITKSHLQSIKGKKDWSSFLEELYLERRNKRGKSSLTKLRELLDDDDLDGILSESKKFRKGFQLD